LFDVAHSLFNHATSQARTALAAGDASGAENGLEQTVTSIFDLINALSPSVTPPPVGKSPNLLLLANLDYPARAERRLAPLRAALDRLGYAHLTIHFTDIAALQAQIGRVDTVLLFRVPALPQLLPPLASLRAAGTTLIFDSDESLAIATERPPLADYHGYLSSVDYDELAYAHALYRAAARLCDYGLAPSQAIADTLAPLCRTGIAQVGGWPGPKPVPRVEVPTKVAATDLVLATDTFLYLDNDKNSPGSALFDCLAARPASRLIVTGPVKFSSDFVSFGGRITHHFRAPLAGIWLGLPTQFADPAYHAQIQWVDSARAGRPCAMVIDNDLLPDLIDSQTLMRADNPSQWGKKLLTLIDDAALAARIGKAAFALADTLPTADAALLSLLHTGPAL
jgi:hypothetical protein